MNFEQQLISWRRELHQNPELSLQEVATTTPFGNRGINNKLINAPLRLKGIELCFNLFCGTEQQRGLGYRCARRRQRGRSGEAGRGLGRRAGKRSAGDGRHNKLINAPLRLKGIELCFNLFCGTEQQRGLAALEVWGVELANGQRVTVGSESQAAAFARQAGSPPTRIERRESSLLFLAQR
jgi:hypothetical protein